MIKNVKFIFRLLSEKLWIKPLIVSILSIGAALLAKLADDSFLTNVVPTIKKISIEDLLSTISASMLVIAIFAVGAMLSAYSAASNTGTPRSYKLIVADDVSQNALSVFIGSFIYSIVATIALQNGFYGKAGHFTLFIITLIVFAIVIITFLGWVERISKLGRLSNTIKKVEKATAEAIIERIAEPRLGGVPVTQKTTNGTPVLSSQIGYVQHINMEQLQELAESLDVIFELNCLPGTFTAPDKPLLHLFGESQSDMNDIKEKTNRAFVIKNDRSFYNDPQFGLIALSEIASRALSPGVNDPGTAIAIIGSYVRLFTLWIKGEKETNAKEGRYDRLEVPKIALPDIFNDAFRPIARDGASSLDVMLRLQQAFKSIAHIGSTEVKEIILSHSRQAYERAASAIPYKEDVDVLKKESVFENNR